MGTSASSRGPGAGTPLLPTWLDEPPIAPLFPVLSPLPVTPLPPGVKPPLPAPPTPAKAPSPQKIEPAIETQRYRAPRRAFGSYVRSGNTESLGRALRDYVRNSSGGARTASRRMAVPKRAASRILAFSQAVHANGTRDALATFGLVGLAGRPIADIYPQLIDALCGTEDGGLTDEAIARNALTEAVAEICDEGMAEGTEFTAEELHELFVRYVSLTIFGRVITDIGQSAISLPTDVADVQALEAEVLDTIRGAVRDSIGTRLTSVGSMPQQQMSGATDEIYQFAFELIAVRGEE